MLRIFKTKARSGSSVNRRSSSI